VLALAFVNGRVWLKHVLKIAAADAWRPKTRVTVRFAAGSRFCTPRVRLRQCCP